MRICLSSFTGNRELPPRFQRKQQQKDTTIASAEAGRPQSPSSFSSTSTGRCPSPTGQAVPFQPSAVGSSYMPMMPPMMIGHGAPATSGPSRNGPSMMNDVSLRPVRNFTPLLRPNTPGTLPKSAQSAHPPVNNRMQVATAFILGIVSVSMLRLC